MSKEEAKKYALEIINNIPNIISNGKLSKDDLGRLKIEFKNQRVVLNDSWKGETLNNRWVVTSYELRNGLIESPLAPNYKGKDTNPLNLDTNHTTKIKYKENNMNYPNLPNSALEISEQPQVKEITNELLKQLQSALKSNTHFSEQVELSLKGIVRILEVLLSLDFFKNANEIDSSLRNSIEWLTHAGESLKAKMKEYESFFNDFNTSMRTNEQEVTATLNANTENIFI